MEPVTVDAIRKTAALQGYAWSDAEVEAILPQVTRALLLVERLGTLPLRDVEPAIQYRMF